MLNFSVTKEALYDKLLNIVVSLLSPEEQKMRQELQTSIAEDRVLLKKGEDKILDILSSSRGMILDDVELIDNLRISKEISKTVIEKIQQTMKKEEELNVSLSNMIPVS